MSYLVLTDVRKQFGETVAVHSFNLAAEKGEFVSFLGPSGCGKTTTLRMIAGFEKPTGGSIVINGEDVTYTSPNKRNVGMVFQSYALFPNMTVADNVAFGLKIRKRPKDQIKKRVGELLEIVNLPDKGARYPNQLSGGQQQRVALARALAFEPQVLLLDEPLSALDAKIRVALRVEIRSIQRQLGITTVYVTHDQEEALSLSDRVVVMSEGRMEQVGTPFEIYNFPSTAFVASFVGTLNVLPGKVTDAAKGELTIAGQPVRIAQAFEGNLGRDVTVALRPEMVTLGSDAAGGENRLTGKVTDVSFLGSIVRLRIQLGEGGPIVILDEFNEPTLKLPELGDTATISFPADGPLVLDAKAPLDSVEALIAEKK
ncbi:MAG: putative spermidine/putrescine transport system ATP-binding protein [Chloroflexota bacterium]|jgi:putative spermidine/putrescine transport system ATP-binding protein|nr:putative spermidine/putrescine transport system ATP-binding protein [Chloroflexota bacterium]